MQDIKLLSRWMKHSESTMHALSSVDCFTLAKRAYYAAQRDCFREVTQIIDLLTDHEIAEMLKGETKMTDNTAATATIPNIQISVVPGVGQTVEIGGRSYTVIASDPQEKEITLKQSA